MENFVAALLVALVQGITEWFPISSSGHNFIASLIFGYNGHGLLYDVSIHFGTLMAVFVYFGKDIIDIVEDFLKGRWESDNVRLGFLIVIATIPAAVAGFLFFSYFEQIFNNLLIVTFGFAITTIFLLISSFDFRGKKISRADNIGFKKAFLIGCVQIAALIPGISRSGSTIAAGYLAGLKEKEAVKFSFLMSIPVVFGANIMSVGNKTLPSEFIWGALVAFFVGLLAIHLAYKYILSNKKNMRWFALYTGLLTFSLLIYQLI